MLTRARLKSFLANLALLVATGGIVFVACEIGIRIFDSMREAKDVASESWAIYDPDVSYRPRPNFGDSNADGLRGPALATPKERFRVLLLGDSVIYYGNNAADAIPGQIERAIARDSNIAKSEVLNAGVRGYTNYQELQYLKHYGLALEPDLVGVAFVLNDLHHVLHKFRIENGKIVGQRYALAAEAVGSVESPLYRLAQKSRFLVWLRHKFSVFDNLIDLYAGRSHYSFEYRPDFNLAWRETAWRDIETQLNEMAALGREHGFRVFLVLFPFGDQLRPDYLARDRSYVLYPQRKLEEITRRLGIPYLDLYPVLDLTHDFLPDRIHLTARGRTVAAERIARFLADERLLPMTTPQARGSTTP